MATKNNLEKMSRYEYEKLYLGDFSKHDETACNALKAYEENAKTYDTKTANGHPVHIPKGERMSDYAKRFGTTVKEMKEHCGCITYLF